MPYRPLHLRGAGLNGGTGAVLRLTEEDAVTAVFVALGAASTCWEDVSQGGVLQSVRCAAIRRELIAHLRKLQLMPDEDP